MTFLNQKNKKLKILNILLLLLFLHLVSCSSRDIENNNVKIHSSKNKITKLAIEKYGKYYILKSSPTKEFILCVQTRAHDILFTEFVSYFVFDNKSKSKILENRIRNGEVSWHSNNEIKIIEIPGIVQKDKTYENGYILNIKLNLKTKINRGFD